LISAIVEPAGRFLAGLKSLAPKNLDFQGREAKFPGKDLR